MPRFAEVTHAEWIGAPVATVRRQFADLRHHIAANVHPKLALRELEARDGVERFEQRVRLLGLTQRDVFERRFAPDGTMTDESVEGFNEGGSLVFRFRPEPRGGRDGTVVETTIRLPLPPVIGPLLRPLLEAQVRRELTAAVAEDKHDLEVRGYPARGAEVAGGVEARA